MIRPLTVAGAAQVRRAHDEPTLLLPVELPCVNHRASTNGREFTSVDRPGLYNNSPMSNLSQIDQIADRVERLLVRHEELQRTNSLLQAQVESLTTERDSLKSRLGAARARVDALLERLPESAFSAVSKGPP